MTPLLLLNAALSVVTIAFGIAAAVRPTLMTQSESAAFGERFFAWMYAARAVPLGGLAAIVPFVRAGAGWSCALVLFAAAAAQLGDVAVGVWRKQRSMIVGGAAVAAVHAITGLAAL